MSEIVAALDKFFAGAKGPAKRFNELPDFNVAVLQEHDHFKAWKVRHFPAVAS